MVNNCEKGYFVFYEFPLSCRFNHLDDSVELNAEELGGRASKYLRRGCLINKFGNGSLYVFADDMNLENLELLLKENNLPFDKEKRKQRWELKGESLEIDEIVYHTPPNL